MVLTVRHKYIKRDAHDDGSVIYDIVVIVGFSSACAISEIGYRASDGSGFQKRIQQHKITKILVMIWSYEAKHIPL